MDKLIEIVKDFCKEKGFHFHGRPDENENFDFFRRSDDIRDKNVAYFGVSSKDGTKYFIRTAHLMREEIGYNGLERNDFKAFDQKRKVVASLRRDVPWYTFSSDDYQHFTEEEKTSFFDEEDELAKYILKNVNPLI